MIASGWAEGVGLGGTLVLNWLVAPIIDGVQSAQGIIGGALLAVVLGTLLQGVVAGLAQEGDLRSLLDQLPRWTWVVATAVGAAMAWLL
jgi:hypothetical protein